MRRPSRGAIVGLWIARALMVALVVVFALALAGCSEGGDSEVQDIGPLSSARAQAVDLPDGGTVVCVFFAHPRGAGISCDWDGAK